MILVIDNYDSFTYNLVQFLLELSEDVQVVRNDVETVEKLLERRPSRIVISPGPGRPEDAGVSCELIRKSGDIPLLGVCLGHQAIGLVFGGQVVRATQLMHGKTSEIFHDGRGLFKDLKNPFTATRYHSLVVERQSVPDELRITAETNDGTVMGVQHRSRPVFGVQFHPESILTSEGPKLLANFVALGEP
ncbi:MAG: aminodeoxychorismate/anthranilate synthase component II [Thermoanaerobaculia bacterium]|nr:Aminodeoxychorismate/anthranilate synthase component 2 [Thermoanaerobaculia bacterium]MCK6685442.1 aminodeoxychorismate/anthranilate synthase component II [Thermoanaerobaculia bacterium]